MHNTAVSGMHYHLLYNLNPKPGRRSVSSMPRPPNTKTCCSISLYTASQSKSLKASYSVNTATAWASCIAS
jgi:hypothetical protein